jgi:tetraacyldisaccharide 4'-kinase
MGGTGKTPATIALAQESLKRGFKPCILTRGYGGKKRGVCFVGKGDGPLINASDGGDEPVLMAYKLKGAMIVKGKNRFQAGLAAQNDCNLFILDDGFQHWALDRDVNIVLLDSERPFGKNGRLFPEGILREPLESLARAHFIVLTRYAQTDLYELTQTIRRYNHKAPIYTASHVPRCLVNDQWQPFDLNTLAGKKVFAFAGIAKPQSFQNLLRSLQADTVVFKAFPDHYSYRQKDIRQILAQSQGLDIITTEKDMVRLVGTPLSPKLKALAIEFEINNPLFYDAVLGDL